MSVLYVTSFAADMWQVTGRHLLDSFRVYQGQAGAQMVACVEGLELPPKYGPPRFLPEIDLAVDPTLRQWLAAQAARIPDYLGGQAQECECPGRERRHALHRHGCHWQWMNRNASRWFRKVVAIARAAALPQTELLVWLDSDTKFVAPLGRATLERILGRSALAYCRGHRPAVESGVLLFDLRRGGREVIHEWLRRYLSGEFARDERWDDGYQLARLIDLNKNPRTILRDLVHPTRWKDRTNDVIPKTLLAKYLHHFKGRHGEGLGLMR